MSAEAPLRPPGPGEPAPHFTAASDANPRFVFDTAAGRYLLLVFLGSAAIPACAEAWKRLVAAQAEGRLDDERCAAFAVTMDPADRARLSDRLPGLRVLRDHDGAVSRLYGAAAGAQAFPYALLLDPALRVLAGAPLAGLPALLEQIGRLPPPAQHAGVETPAPVLLLPRVLEPEFCARLIALYDAHGGAESGFMRDVEGRTVEVADPRHKRRRDHVIEDEETKAALRARLARRLIPEIRRAFQFDATRIERYIVACYDAADGGHFRAHRDNTTLGTAHRRFAVSINLNAEFEGGLLRFPEFGARLYRPPPGGAVVFSCSLLHEVTPVTRGRRYATLPFLYDEAAAALRERNQRHLGPAEAAPPG